MDKIAGTFTDEDLKRLRESSYRAIEDGKIPGLIARLEAAEKCIHPVPTCHAGCVCCDNREAWRKAAGK